MSSANSSNNLQDDEVELCEVCHKEGGDPAHFIGCDGCNIWFHFDCVGPTQDLAKKIEDYFVTPAPVMEKSARGREFRQIEARKRTS